MSNIKRKEPDMKSILTQLYEGKLYPLGANAASSDTYRKIREEHHQRHEDFQKKLEQLDPALPAQFTKIMDDLFEELPLDVSESFINGFCLGAKMMIEIYLNEF